MIRPAQPAHGFSWRLPAPRNPWEPIVVAAVVGLIGFSTALFGGVEAWLQPVLLAVGGLLAIPAVTYRSPVGARLPLAALAVLGAIGLLQLVPVPSGAIAWLSPERAAVLTQYGGAPETATLSYAPAETRRLLAHLFLGASVFGAVAACVRTPRRVTLLLAGVGLVGLAEACLAIAQASTEAPGIFWDPALNVGAWFGSFVNHSNFAQSLNAAIGAALGLLLIRLAEDRRRRRRNRQGAIASLAQRHGGMLVGIAVGVVALVASLSRAGVVAGLIAGGVVGLLPNRGASLGSRGWLLGGAVGFAALTVLFLPTFDSVFDRVEEVSRWEDYADRWELTQNTLRAGVSHLATGVGLGAHRYAFSAYDTTGSKALAEQADNDYAQLFEEGGLPGAIAGLVLLAGLCWTTWLALSGTRSAFRYAAYGTVYALVAALVHSLTDFGQRLPAVFCSTAALCGLAASLAASHSTRTGPTTNRRGVVSLVLTGAVIAPLWGWLFWQSLLDYRAERWWAQAYGYETRLSGNDWEGPLQDYVDLIAAAEAAHRLRPTEVEYAYWLNMYRWQAFNAAGAGADSQARQVVASKIADELAAARGCCPTYGPVHTLEGRLRLAANDPSGMDLLESGLRLAPNDPEACLAIVQANPADLERGIPLLERFVALTPAPEFATAATVAIDELGRLDVAERLAGKDPDRLRQLADVVAERDTLAGEATRLLLAAEKATEDRIDSGEALPSEVVWVARRAAEAGESDRAIKLYRVALVARYGNVPWRLELAEVLFRAGQEKQARREARLCERLKPGLRRTQRLLDQLSQTDGGSDATE